MRRVLNDGAARVADPSMDVGRVRAQHGFTLLELLVVVAILGSLAGVAVFGVAALDDRADEATLVDAGLIDAESELNDVELLEGTYAVVTAPPDGFDWRAAHDVLIDVDGQRLVATVDGSVVMEVDDLAAAADRVGSRFERTSSGAVGLRLWHTTDLSVQHVVAMAR